jgi:hypothetical protein
MSVTVSSIDVLDEVVRRPVAARDGGRSESDLVNEFVLWRREAPLDGDAAAIREAAIARLRRADNGGEVPLYEAVLADFAWLRGELEAEHVVDLADPFAERPKPNFGPGLAR